MFQTIGVGAVLFVIILGVVFYALSRYKVMGTETAMIITGSALGTKNVETDGAGKKIKIVVGGGAVVLPIIHKLGTLNLQPSNLEVEAKNIVTTEDVPINVKAVATVRFYSDPKNLIQAASNFMGVAKEIKERQVKEILEGHLKAIIATLTVEQSNKNRDDFSKSVKTLAEADLQKLGIEIVTFNVTSVTDDNDYINSLAAKRTAEVKRDANIAVVESETETRIKNAESRRLAEVAELERRSEIAAAKKDNELKLAEYKIAEDTAKANASIAFDLEKTKRNRELKSEEIQVEITEREKRIELEEKEIVRKEREYTATVEKLADAEFYKKVKDSEALKISMVNQSEALKIQEINKATAEAEKIKLEGIAKGEAIRAEALAVAEGIEKKGLAEAKVLEEKARAFEEFGNAAMMDMIIKMLPDYAKAIADPISNIDKVTIIDSGNGSGISSLSGNVTNLMAGLQESLKETTGLDMKELIENYAGKQNLKGELGAIARGVNKDVIDVEVEVGEKVGV
jgi:flotillin